MSDGLVFGEAIAFQEFPSQRSIKVCQTLPFRARPTAQQSDDETQVTPTSASMSFGLSEGTIVHGLGPVGVGVGVFVGVAVAEGVGVGVTLGVIVGVGVAVGVGVGAGVAAAGKDKVAMSAPALCPPPVTITCALSGVTASPKFPSSPAGPE